MLIFPSRESRRTALRVGSSSVDTRGVCLALYEVVVVLLVVAVRSILTAVSAALASLTFVAWVYITTVVYSLDALEWLSANTAAADRVASYEVWGASYGQGSSALAVACDYLVVFCATATTYEAIFVTTSLANRLCLLACVSLVFAGHGDASSFELLGTDGVMVDPLGTTEMLNNSWDDMHRQFYSGTPRGDIAERNRYYSRKIRWQTYSVKITGKWVTPGV